MPSELSKRELALEPDPVPPGHPLGVRQLRLRRWQLWWGIPALILSGVVAGLFEPEASLLIAAALAVVAGLYFNNHLRNLRLAHS